MKVLIRYIIYHISPVIYGTIHSDKNVVYYEMLMLSILYRRWFNFPFFC